METNDPLQQNTHLYWLNDDDDDDDLS